MWSVVVTPALHKTCLAKYGQHVTAVGRSLDATSDDRTCEIVTLVTTQNMLNMAHQAAGREYQVDYNQCKDSPCFASLLASRFRCLLYLVSTCMLVAPPLSEPCPPSPFCPSPCDLWHGQCVFSFWDMVLILSQYFFHIQLLGVFVTFGRWMKAVDKAWWSMPYGQDYREVNEGFGQDMMSYATWSGLSGADWRLWRRHDDPCHVVRTSRRRRKLRMKRGLN